MKRVSISKIVKKPISGEWGNEAESETDGIPVIRNTNFSDDGRIDLHDVAFREIPNRKIKKKKLKPGDIIIEKSGGSKNQPVGRVVFFDIDDDKNYLFSNFTSAIRPKKEVEPKYVHYGLLHSYMRGGSELFQNKTTGIRNLQLKRYLDKVKIPLPNLSEQKAIVVKLDRAQRLIDIDKEMLAKYDELIQSVFLEMFGDPVRNEKGWEVKSFDDMAVFDTNMTSDFEKYGDLLHVGIGNIERDTGKISGCITAKEEGITSGKYLFNEEHIIYSKIRPYLNKVALPNFKGLCSADAYPIKPIKNVTTRTYLTYLLRSESFLDFISKHSTRTNIPKANKSQMKQFEGIVPPIDIQYQFEMLVSQINNEKDKVQISLKKSEELFSSLVQGVFG